MGFNVYDLIGKTLFFVVESEGFFSANFRINVEDMIVYDDSIVFINEDGFEFKFIGELIPVEEFDFNFIIKSKGTVFISYTK